MKFCPKCGNKLQPGDRFCEKCGFQVAESQEEKPIVTEEPTPKLQQVEKKKPAVSPISAQSQPKKEKVAPVTPAVSKKGNKKANVSKDKLADLKNKVNMDKLQEQINKDPKKAGIFGGIALVIVIALGIAVHMIQLQPDHALVNKPYHMTLSIKTTSQGFFTGTHTETTTKSEVVYLDKHQGKAYAGDSVTSAKQAAKDKNGGVNYTLEDNTLKLPLGEDFNVQINDLHRSGDSYVGTLKQIGDDADNITGTVTFKKAQ